MSQNRPDDLFCKTCLEAKQHAAVESEYIQMTQATLIATRWRVDQPARITHQKLRTLRARHEYSQLKPSEVFVNRLKEMLQAWLKPAWPLDNRSQNMCRNYGHILRGDFTKTRPGHAAPCTDCGTPVHSAHQLRRASVR
jgi:hypothetical protein